MDVIYFIYMYIRGGAEWVPLNPNLARIRIGFFFAFPYLLQTHLASLPKSRPNRDGSGRGLAKIGQIATPKFYDLFLGILFVTSGDMQCFKKRVGRPPKRGDWQNVSPTP